MNVEQAQLYEKVKGQLLGAFLDGFNATVLAYGQTGSGKTFTMGSEAEYNTEQDDEQTSSGFIKGNEEGQLGLIPRFVTDTFLALQHMESRNYESAVDSSNFSSFKCSASFLEVYGEEIHDLLSTTNTSKPATQQTSGGKTNSLPIREDSNGGVVVAGLTHVPVSSVHEALQVLKIGTKHRTTASTLMNRTSSRSHAVFTISLTRTVSTPSSSEVMAVGANNSNGVKPVEVTTTSKLTFVDLAGSERMKKTGAEGERAREGIKINEGLLALGNVINALADESVVNSENNNSPLHVPYRQSKLTRLLQDALGGNSQTLFLACVSPADCNLSETLSTLKYANRARNIKNAPTKNVDTAALELQRLSSLNFVLQSELIRLKFSRHDDLTTFLKLDESAQERVGIQPSEPLASPLPDDFDVDQLIQRPDVQEYLKGLFQKAEQKHHKFGANSSSDTYLPASVGLLESEKFNIPESHENSDVVARQSSHSIATGSNTEAGSSKTCGRKHERIYDLQRSSSTSIIKSKEPSACALSGSLRDEIESTTFLLEVDPDHDMAILDQLLELQQEDQQFDASHREGQEKVQAVEEELKQQETLLLQLRHSLEVYHEMKHRYEVLVTEIQDLEYEKSQLAEQLEKALADPAKGCSDAIRKKLDRVEQNLAKAREETRKHQKMYKQVEVEARKCQILEDRIADLKYSKVALIRRQKEAAIRHKIFTEEKTREIQALKKKERQTEKQLSKVGIECSRYRANLDRRKEYCDKLSSKLKQTEAHLMKVLAMRKKDLHRRSRGGRFLSTREGQMDNGLLHSQPSELTKDQGSSAYSDEIRSSVFLLRQMISDRVANAHGRKRYEERVVEYSKLMKEMKKEVSAYNSLKASPTSDSEVKALKEHEQNIEELELKLELVTGELDDISARAQMDKENDKEEHMDAYEQESDFLSKLDAQVLRGVFLDFLRDFEVLELEAKLLKEKITRKDAAILGFEKEVEMLNRRLDSLAVDYAGTKLSDVNGQALASNFEEVLKEMTATQQKSLSLEEKVNELEASLAGVRAELNFKSEELISCREKLKLFKLSTNTGQGAEYEQKLQNLQALWSEIGLDEKVRQNQVVILESSIENTFDQLLNEGRQFRIEKQKELKDLISHLGTINNSLGCVDEALTTKFCEKSVFTSSILEEIEVCRKEIQKSMPRLQAALDRRDKMAQELEQILEETPFIYDKTTEINLSKLHNCHIRLDDKITKQQKFKLLKATPGPSARDKWAETTKNVESVLQSIKFDVSGDVDSHGVSEFRSEDFSNGLVKSNLSSGVSFGTAGSLSDSFLDACEQELRCLRVKKSQFLLANNELHESTWIVVKEMHLSAKEIFAILAELASKADNNFPSWWDPSVGFSVCASLTQNQSTFRATRLFTKHLRFISDYLNRASSARRLLSTKLKGIVETSHNILLATLEDDFEAKDAYSSFRNALFDLPTLSKEHIEACTEEIKLLIKAADEVADSETEALTVVWDALDVSQDQRERFWSSIETYDFEKSNDILLNMEEFTASQYVEEWLITVAHDAYESKKKLDSKLGRLKEIHDQVEGNRLKQDLKTKILSLDSELRMVSARLSDFEEQAGRKQRLTTKKINSSNFLKEERFRKHVQAKFASKLENLGRLLQEWEKREKCRFDSNALSEDVKALLINLDGFDAWVEQRTAFMHLKTTKPKGTTRRIASDVEPAVLDSKSSETISRPRYCTVDQEQNVDSQMTPEGHDNYYQERSTSLTRQLSNIAPITRDSCSTTPPKSSLQMARLEVLQKTHIARKKDERSRDQTQVTTNHPSFRKDGRTRGKTSNSRNATGLLSPNSPSTKVQTTPKRLVVGGSAPNPFGHVLAKSPSK